MTMHDPRLIAGHREYGRKDANGAADDAGDRLELKTIMSALEKRDGEIKQFAEKAAEEIKTTGQMAKQMSAARRP